MKQFALLITIGIMLNASAHDVTVNITGAIIDSTCIVTTSASNQTVQMGNVETKRFTMVGSKTALIPFNISLEDCGATATGVAVTFLGNKDTNNSTLLALENVSGAASGIGIGILDDTQTVVPPNTASKIFPIDGAGGQTSTSLAFYAQYTATQPQVTAGTANASATFTLTYP